MWCQCLSVYEHGLLTGGDAGGVPGSSGNGQRHVGDACSPAPLFSGLFDDSVRLAGRRFALHYSNAGRSRVERITMALFKVVVYHVSLTVRRPPVAPSRLHVDWACEEIGQGKSRGASTPVCRLLADTGRRAATAAYDKLPARPASSR
jgi:hypothetical protein